MRFKKLNDNQTFGKTLVAGFACIITVFVFSKITNTKFNYTVAAIAGTAGAVMVTGNKINKTRRD